MEKFCKIIHIIHRNVWKTVESHVECRIYAGDNPVKKCRHTVISGEIEAKYVILWACFEVFFVEGCGKDVEPVWKDGEN